MFDITLICLMYQGTVSQGKLLFFGLLCQDVTFKRMLSFDLSGTGKLETLLGTGLRFHFRHWILVYLLSHLLLSSLGRTSPGYFAAFLGEMNMVIRFPSSFGICSTFPRSSRSVAKRSSRISPWSLNTIDRPL